jgi:hypothetical protein
MIPFGRVKVVQSLLQLHLQQPLHYHIHLLAQHEIGKQKMEITVPLTALFPSSERPGHP